MQGFKLFFALLLICLLLPRLVLAAPPPLQAQLAITPPTTDSLGNPLPPGTVLTYNVYQGLKGAETLVQSNLGVTSIVITSGTGIALGATVCFQVTAVDSGGESARSPEACKTFPAPSAAPGLTVS